LLVSALAVTNNISFLSPQAHTHHPVAFATML